MAFWALGAFDKVKNMSITNVTKKLKDYVVLSLLLSTWQKSKNPLPNPSTPSLKRYPKRGSLLHN